MWLFPNSHEKRSRLRAFKKCLLLFTIQREVLIKHGLIPVKNLATLAESLLSCRTSVHSANLRETIIDALLEGNPILVPYPCSVHFDINN